MAKGATPGQLPGNEGCNKHPDVSTFFVRKFIQLFAIWDLLGQIGSNTVPGGRWVERKGGREMEG